VKKISIFVIVYLCLQSLGFALETDQFISGDVELKDASDVMNQYFFESMNKALVWANKNDALNLSCQDVSIKVMALATGKFTLSQASTYASATPLIERYPEDSVSERGYKNQSFYEHAWLPLQVVDLARTISINNIHVGTDKLGHFSHMGLRYLKAYLKLVKKGISRDEAIRQTIVNGFSSEYGFLGYSIDGVLSYSDLEANYQGFMFALDMCRGNNPYLLFKNNLWQENPDHKFDIRDYFTPKMDESYNISYWRKPLYKLVKAKLVAEYCAIKDNPAFIARMNYYKSIDKNTLNDILEKQIIEPQDRFARAKEDLFNSCLSSK
jgi:hypothetical protein